MDCGRKRWERQAAFTGFGRLGVESMGLTLGTGMTTCEGRFVLFAGCVVVNNLPGFHSWTRLAVLGSVRRYLEAPCLGGLKGWAGKVISITRERGRRRRGAPVPGGAGADGASRCRAPGPPGCKDSLAPHKLPCGACGDFVPPTVGTRVFWMSDLVMATGDGAAGLLMMSDLVMATGDGAAGLLMMSDLVMATGDGAAGLLMGTASGSASCPVRRTAPWR